MLTPPLVTWQEVIQSTFSWALVWRGPLQPSFTRSVAQNSGYRQALWASLCSYSVSSLSWQSLFSCYVATRLWVEFLEVRWSTNYRRQFSLPFFGLCTLFCPRLKLIATSKDCNSRVFTFWIVFATTVGFANKFLLLIVLFNSLSSFDFKFSIHLAYKQTRYYTQILNWLLLHALAIRDPNCKELTGPSRI